LKVIKAIIIITGSCGASQKKGQRKSAHLSSAGKKSSLTMMKRNRKRKTTKRTEAKRRHIAGRAYDTGCGESRQHKKNPMVAKETIGVGGGRKYADSQFSDQNRQDAIRRVSAV